MKLIGLDVGTKRIGVAKADSAVRIAVPYAAVEVDGTELDKIASLAGCFTERCFGSRIFLGLYIEGCRVQGRQ